MPESSVSYHIEDSIVRKEEVVNSHQIFSKHVGKEHRGKEADSGYGKGEDERECTLTLNCRKTHESGDKWDVHGDLLCVDFAVGILVFDVKFVGMDCKYYTYVLVGGGYEDC